MSIRTAIEINHDMLADLDPKTFKDWLLSSWQAEPRGVKLLGQRHHSDPEFATRWIPVEQYLPREEGRYAVLYRYRKQPWLKAFIADFYPTDNRWALELKDTKITHWLALPIVPAPVDDSPT